MDNQDILDVTTDLLRQDFNLASNEDVTPTEAQVLRWLADAVDHYLTHRTGQLLSLLYTLDVAEADVSRALHPLSEEPANEALARLIFERQRRRALTKAHYKPEPLEDEDLAW